MSFWHNLGYKIGWKLADYLGFTPLIIDDLRVREPDLERLIAQDKPR